MMRALPVCQRYGVIGHNKRNIQCVNHPNNPKNVRGWGRGRGKGGKGVGRNWAVDKQTRVRAHTQTHARCCMRKHQRERKRERRRERYFYYRTPRRFHQRTSWLVCRMRAFVTSTTLLVSFPRTEALAMNICKLALLVLPNLFGLLCLNVLVDLAAGTCNRRVFEAILDPHARVRPTPPHRLQHRRSLLPSLRLSPRRPRRSRRTALRASIPCSSTSVFP